MRLVCPNCDAEYEVDDHAIPRAGRDVQCSNCGHAWFQTHPEVEAEREAEAALYEAPVALAPAAAEVYEPESAPPFAAEPDPVPAPDPGYEPDPTFESDPEDELEADGGDLPPPAPSWADLSSEGQPAAPLTPEQAVAATLQAAAAVREPPSAPPATPAPAPSRALDASVLAVLREEAEREVSARRSEQPGIETQVEMGLDDEAPVSGGLAASAMRRIARLKGGAEPEAVPVAKTRREMLPAIDEINSTLRATSDRHSDEDYPVVDTMDEPRRGRSGFGRGFMTLVILAVIIVALYIAAPVIASKYPSLAGAATTYVEVIDALRSWLDVKIKSLIETLRGYEGGQAG
jgi:predicted Zn finger-like uncharacterized protein